MSRTLGSVIPEHHNQDDDHQNEPFYLKDQLPMFLAHNQDHPTSSQNMGEDMIKCKELIESLCDSQLKTRQGLEQISSLLKQQTDLSKAMGYFSAKNLVFLEYLMNLKLYELFKINGKSLTTGNGLELYQRLAYLKTLLLKLQPVQKKLDYQKNKILKHSDKVTVTKQKEVESEQQQIQEQQEQSGKIKGQQLSEEQQDAQNQEDEMAYKPRPSALLKIKHQKDQRVAKTDKYEAPKVSSNLSKQDKMRQRMERQKQIRKVGLIRRLQSDLIDDDRAQERFLGDQINEKFKRKFQDKINHEEEAFTRIPDNKKDKYYMKQMIKNSLRKDQLEDDLREVKMVRELFEQEDKMQNKILSEKRQKEGKFKYQKNERDNDKEGKFKYQKNERRNDKEGKFKNEKYERRNDKEGKFQNQRDNDKRDNDKEGRFKNQKNERSNDKNSKTKHIQKKQRK